MFQEIISLTSQLAYTYSANRNASTPFSSILFSSFSGSTRERIEKQNNAAYQRWTGTEWWDGGYEELWSGKSLESQGDETKSSSSRTGKDKVVYLTADADDELSELKEDETYIIGGIVDHNRYKVLLSRCATVSSTLISFFSICAKERQKSKV